MNKKKWFKKAIMQKKPNSLGGWKKELSTEERIKLALRSRPKNWKRETRYRSAGRALQALANVTKDKKTREIAKKDAEYFFKKLKK